MIKFFILNIRNLSVILWVGVKCFHFIFRRKHEKILSSLVCVGVLSTFASANMVNVDFTYSNLNLPDDGTDELDDDGIIMWNIKLQKHKNSDDDTPFVVSLGIGGRNISSYTL